MIVAQRTNLGLARMADASGIGYDTLLWTQEWYVREETLRAANLAINAVIAAREMSRVAQDALRAAVDQARGRDHTWQEIGDVLDTTRQAAFQRFGRPIDPHRRTHGRHPAARPTIRCRPVAGRPGTPSTVRPVGFRAATVGVKRPRRPNRPSRR